MLTLQRSIDDQGIVIVTPDGQELRIYVTEISRNKVRLGFTKFKDFGVWRGEVWEKKKAEGSQA